ncbi:MAG: DUF4124 domain-containing protein [Betaproteobacteria bacterium]|nr:DUF4124 domain-containing protein [Betaproteobacteria bacterium]
MLSLAAALAAMSHAVADTYKWIDDKGNVQYTDRLPPDLGRGMTELNKQGMTRKVTEPAPTAEQRKAKEEALEQERQAERARRYKRYQDDALLSSYASENDIDLARRRNLALVGAGIISAEARIKALEKRRIYLQRETLFYEKKPVPEKLKRELASVVAEIPKQHALIQEKNQEALEVINRYEQQKARFRELKAQMAREALAVKRQ